MPNSHPLPPKKEVALALLERSSDRGIFVHLDPRLPAVAVPPWFKKQPQLVLQVGLNMPVPIPDLNLDEQGMSCTLSFNRSPFYCVVPWSSVFAMVGDDGRGMVWPDDVPSEVPLGRQAQTQQKPATPQPSPVRAVADPPGKSSKSATKPKRTRKRPALVAVPNKEAEKAPKKKRATPLAAAKSHGDAKPAARDDAAPAAKRARVGESPAASKGKKRELPPYLRVVK